MNIGLTCPASLPASQFGGILFLCVDIAKGLSEKGNEITIFTTDLDFANNPKTFNKNLPRKEKFSNFVIDRSHVWFSYGLFYVNPGMFFRMMNSDIDLIHSIGVRSFQSFIGAIVSKRKNIPFVISDQGGLTTHPDLKTNSFLKKIFYKLQLPMIKYIINQATQIIVANEYEKEIFLHFANEKKIKIIKNGINLKNFQESKITFKIKYKIDCPFFLFLGRFTKIKGIDVLLHSISHIKDHVVMSNYKLVIMGADFGYEKEMYDMIQKLKINKNIIVIKNPPREDVISAYNDCEFLVLPSRWELSPLTPLEGFAFKKPVISTTAHGIPYTISNNVNSILVSPENPKELSLAILELIDNKNKKTELGNAGFQLVNEECNSNKMVETILKIYNNLFSK